MAEVGRHRVLCLSRRADQQRGVGRIPLSRDLSLATQPAAAQPEGWLDLAAGGEAG